MGRNASRDGVSAPRRSTQPRAFSGDAGKTELATPATTTTTASRLPEAHGHPVRPDAQDAGQLEGAGPPEWPPVILLNFQQRPRGEDGDLPRISER